MNGELYELRDELVSQKTGKDLVEYLWSINSKNATGYGYMAGVLDSLFWAEKITQEEYTFYIMLIGI